MVIARRRCRSRCAGLSNQLRPSPAQKFANESTVLFELRGRRGHRGGAVRKFGCSAAHAACHGLAAVSRLLRPPAHLAAGPTEPWTPRSAYRAVVLRAVTRPAMAMRTLGGSWAQRRRPAAGHSTVVGRDGERAASSRRLRPQPTKVSADEGLRADDPFGQAPSSAPSSDPFVGPLVGPLPRAGV